MNPRHELLPPYIYRRGGALAISATTRVPGRNGFPIFRNVSPPTAHLERAASAAAGVSRTAIVKGGSNSGAQ